MVALPFLYNEALVSCSTQVVWVWQNKSHNYSQRFPRHFTSMHLTAALGLTYFLQHLITGYRNELHLYIDVHDSYGETPLSRAAMYGHESAVELLLRNGAIIDARGAHIGRGDALYVASMQGFDKIVELLLRKDVDVHTRSSRLGLALKGASSGGHNKVVELLLANGAIDK